MKKACAGGLASVWPSVCAQTSRMDVQHAGTLAGTHTRTTCWVVVWSWSLSCALCQRPPITPQFKLWVRKNTGFRHCKCLTLSVASYTK